MVQCYITNNHTCRCVKAPRDRYNSLLKSLLIPFQPRTNVTFDFVTSLLISNGYNVILIVVDCLTKDKHYILCNTNKNGKTTEATTQLLFWYIWKLFGFPLSVPLDGGPQFISEV